MPCQENSITQKIIGGLIEVHRHLGPGLLESVYEECLAWELTDRGLVYERQRRLDLVYKGRRITDLYRLDFVVQDLVVLELKSVSRLEPIHEAQLLTYLRLSNLRLGLLANFNVPIMKDGIRHLVRGLREESDLRVSAP